MGMKVLEATSQPVDNPAAGSGAANHAQVQGDSYRSSQQDLLELRVVARELLVALAQLGRLAAGVQHGGVVAPPESLADLGQALLRELLRQRHRHLARAGD